MVQWCFVRAWLRRDAQTLHRNEGIESLSSVWLVMSGVGAGRLHNHAPTRYAYVGRTHVYGPSDRFADPLSHRDRLANTQSLAHRSYGLPDAYRAALLRRWCS